MDDARPQTPMVANIDLIDGLRISAAQEWLDRLGNFNVAGDLLVQLSQKFRDHALAVLLRDRVRAAAHSHWSAALRTAQSVQRACPENSLAGIYSRFCRRRLSEITEATLK